MAVLYTTHYMEEAERLCDRIGIVDLGELKAEGTRAELVALVGEHDRVRLEATRRPRAAAARCSRRSRRCVTASAADGVARADRRRRPRRCCPSSCARRPTPARRSQGVDVDEPDLEAVFLHLTGRALRD